MVTAANEIQLFPTGKFCSTDGRPHDVPHWFIDATLAAQIIAEFSSAREPHGLVDYEHQTLLAALTNNPTFNGALALLMYGRDRAKNCAS